jgi:hypothetical protein
MKNSPNVLLNFSRSQAQLRPETFALPKFHDGPRPLR